MSRHRPPINPPDRDDCLFVTHPSGQNATYTNTAGRGGWKREERDTEKWELDEKMYNRGLGHDAAFLVPLPVYYGYGVPGTARSEVAEGLGMVCLTVSGS